jgi:hypothetical protein
MRGFVTIDRQPASGIVAMWVTARVGSGRIDQSWADDEDGGQRSTDTRPMNVNAVVVDTNLDPSAIDKVRSLTRAAVVVATAGSVLDGLPVDGDPIHPAEFEALLDETEAQQRRILEALDVYAINISPKTGKVLKPRSIVRPDWLPRPSLEQFKPHEDSAPARALATANFVCAAWRYWLASDDERRARALPSGRTPPRMPPDLRSPVVPDFPPTFASALRTQDAV